MQPQRLLRLMSIINDIKHNPESNPDELCRRFQISHRQFYKDRERLLSMGYDFHFSRRLGRLILDKEPLEEIKPHQFTAFLLAAISALKEDDLSLSLISLEGLRALIGRMAAKNQKIMNNALNQLFMQQGLKCGQEFLDELISAAREGRRVVALLKDMEPQLMLDPQKLILYKGELYVLSNALAISHPLTVMLPAGYDDASSSFCLGLKVEHIRKVVTTPFFAIQN